jgi:Family of unknown function (DUF6544)
MRRVGQLRREFERRAERELARPRSGGVVTDRDLDALPGPVARYIGRSGGVGHQTISNFRASIHGRIRSGADARWMTFTGAQVNTCVGVSSRLFFIKASMRGLPVDVFHCFVDDAASMVVQPLSMFTIADARGPQMNRSETVTILNDTCLMAPAALIDPAFAWRSIDDRTAEVTFRRLDETVSATLHFGDDDRLVDFVSDDRYRSSSDGASFTPQRWSTPVDRYRSFDDRRVMTFGKARWHAPPPEGEFTYLEFELDDIAYNVGALDVASGARPRA